jgi:hypothetical protein
MIRLLLIFNLVFCGVIGSAQISVQKIISLVGFNWDRANGQIALDKSIEAESNYFFEFSNAIYPAISDLRKVDFLLPRKNSTCFIKKL